MKSLATLPILSLLPGAALLLLASAKTDYDGCTSYTTMITVDPSRGYGGGNIYPSIMYYDPTNLEICQYVDCGGGRAPPKTTVPGCYGYTGTETVTPSYLSSDPLETDAAAEETGSATATATATTADTTIAAVTGSESVTELLTTAAPTVEETGSSSGSGGSNSTATGTGTAGDATGEPETVDENGASRAGTGFAFALPAVFAAVGFAVMAY
ncbi:hypothetical protein MKZ38_003866 [Zalerion maritima]|uniref:Uncharacterized protein n=1 Tax=Zalerion maritima TaxID=339359 RepID=A0AAD5WRG8_9PEZI|nr:hypothetical protein MKZ38_003866 [Zalerion maritima]